MFFEQILIPIVPISFLLFMYLNINLIVLGKKYKNKNVAKIGWLGIFLLLVIIIVLSFISVQSKHPSLLILGQALFISGIALAIYFVAMPIISSKFYFEIKNFFRIVTGVFFAILTINLSIHLLTPSGDIGDLMMIFTASALGINFVVAVLLSFFTYRSIKKSLNSTQR